MNAEKLEAYSEKWKLIEERVGGETGKEIVKALKELYAIYDDSMVAWMASLYDPASGAWYHSRSGQMTEGYGPDAESTIEVYQFWEATGMTGGKPYREVTPQWLKEKTAKFCYELQDPDGYFYHPQWGKQFYIDHSLYSRRSRDSQWCKTLIGAFSDGKLKYPLPGENLKAGGDKLNEVPERWRSVENYKKYLYSLDLKNRSYHVGNTLQAEAPERVMYGEALGTDLNKITVDFLDENVSPVTGLWQANDATDYYAVSGLCKITWPYNTSRRPLLYPREGIRSAMMAILSDERAGGATDTLNPWSCITNGISNVRNYGKGDEFADEILREVWEWAPAGIRKTAEKMEGFKMPDGGMSYSLEGFCCTSQGAPVALCNVREGDINGNCCASSAIINYVFRALGIDDISIPLFDGDDLKRFLEIVEERECEYNEKG